MIIALLYSDYDYRAIVLRLKQKKPEAVFLNTNSDQLFYNLLKQIRDLNWSVQIYGVYVPGSPNLLNLAGNLANGIVFADSPTIENIYTNEGRQLFSEFTNKYGQLRSVALIFPASFEALRLFTNGAKSGKDMRDFLYSGHFDGLFGKYSFDKNGDIVGVKHVLKIINGKTPELLN